MTSCAFEGEWWRFERQVGVAGLGFSKKMRLLMSVLLDLQKSA